MVRPFIEENDQEGVFIIGDSANVSCKAQPAKEVYIIPQVENFADEYMNF
jgi:hypothetical protein